jgi:hypothetical protein
MIHVTAQLNVPNQDKSAASTSGLEIYRTFIFVALPYLLVQWVYYFLLSVADTLTGHLSSLDHSPDQPCQVQDHASSLQLHHGFVH